MMRTQGEYTARDYTEECAVAKAGVRGGAHEDTVLGDVVAAAGGHLLPPVLAVHEHVHAVVALRGLHVQPHAAALAEALCVVLHGAHVPALVQGALREAVHLHQLVVVRRRALLALHTRQHCRISIVEISRLKFLCRTNSTNSSPHKHSRQARHAEEECCRHAPQSVQMASDHRWYHIEVDCTGL